MKRWQYKQDRDCILEINAGSALQDRTRKAVAQRLCKIRNTSYERKQKKEQNYLYRKKTIRKKMIHYATHTHTQI